MLRNVVRLLVLALLGAGLTLVTPQQAYAAVPAPKLVAPVADAQVVGNPTLKWQPLLHAATYDVQVSADASFPTPYAWSARTANTNATPPRDLPLGTYYWRVRGVDTAGAGGAFASSQFVKVSRTAPVTKAPINGASIAYPAQVLEFSWLPIANAKTYEIQIDDDPLFVGAPAPTSTANTTFVPLAPPVFGTTFYWRVRAKSNNSVYSDWSPASSYSMAWSPSVQVTLTSPPSTNVSSVEHVVLAWQALPGAAYYQVQISPDVNFNNPIVKGTDVTQGRKVVGTRFSDNDSDGSDALNLPAGAYYWRVRAMSTSSVAEPSAWSSTWTFTKAWPGSDTLLRPNGYAGAAAPDAQTTLVSPADGDSSLTQPRFSWTAQRGAGAYEVQFGRDANFSPGQVASCVTNHTTIVPYSSTVTSAQCVPYSSGVLVPGTALYWRVRALDTPGTVLGQWTSARSFLYDPAVNDSRTPPSGTTMARPVLTWGSSDNVSQYKVTITGSGTGCNSFSATVYGTVYTPETLNPTCVGSWSWTVQGVQLGDLTRVPPASTFSWEPPTGTVAVPGPLTLTPIAGYRPPRLSWDPVINTSATPLTKPIKYRVFISKAGFDSFAQVAETTSTTYAYAGTSPTFGALLSEGDYEVFVRAVTSTGTEIGTSPRSTFHINALGFPTLSTPANCPLGTCAAVEYDTPTFNWAPVPGAGVYLLYLATDPNFTNITRVFRTPHTQLTPTESLPDSQAGQATYWYVRPCASDTACAVFDASVYPRAHAFRKQSVKVQTVAPSAGQIVTEGHVTFSWKDYLWTNSQASGAVGATQEAAYYRVEVSNTANFTTILETSPRIDQTEYTAATKTYPDGPLYWRVRAFDNSNNPLTYSTPVAFTKAVPGPTGLTPDNCAAPGCAPSGSNVPTLRWDAMSHSGQYEVEIYRSLDRGSAISPTNRVWSTTTRMRNAAPTSSLPVGEYGWRVRRIDANGNPGRWSSDASATPGLDSALAHFAIGVSKPVLLAPTSGSVIKTNSVLLTWRPVTGATWYRVEASLSSGFGSVLESVQTDITAWAPSLYRPLWPQTTIYWRVHALDGNGGILATSATWNLVRDSSSIGEYTPVNAFRVLDTRTPSQPITAGQTRVVTVNGKGGVPVQGVSAVVVNVTVTNPTAASVLTVYPANVTRPDSSNLNVLAGQTVTNLVTTGVSPSGQLAVYNMVGSVDVIVDVVGYYSDGSLPRGSRFVAGPSPVRLLDTRGGGGVPPAPWQSGEARRVEVAGLANVPANASAVVVNLTAVTPSRTGFLTAYPTGSARPDSRNVSFAAGSIVANLVQVGLGTGGDVTIYNQTGATDVLVDVIGWFVPANPTTLEPVSGGARFIPVAPARIFDSRQAAYSPILSSLVPRAVQVRGQGGVPAGGEAVGVIANLTVTEAVGAGWLSMYPEGAIPATSNLNYGPAQNVPNLVVARIASDGKVRVVSSAKAHAIVDVVGWFRL